MFDPIQPAETARKLGNLTVTALSDGHLDVPGTYFSNLSRAEQLRVEPTTRLGANTWLIDEPDRKVLVDAGSGSWLRDRFAASGAIGWQGDHRTATREAITDIIITHMHADHIGGLVAGNVSLFPNAQIHLQAVEWTFWTDPALPGAVPEDRRPLIELIQMLAAPIAGQIRLQDGEADLGGGIRLLPAEGHTPGHQVVHLSAGSEQLFLLADTAISDALQFANPDIHYALDSDPQRAAQTRKALFDRIAVDRILFAATHLTTGSFGTLERQGSGYGFVAA